MAPRLPVKTAQAGSSEVPLASAPQVGSFVPRAPVTLSLRVIEEREKRREKKRERKDQDRSGERETLRHAAKPEVKRLK